MSMSTSHTTSTEAVSYGGFVDAIGGIATVVLAIVGLAGVRADILIAVATIVFGVALLIQGGTIVSEYAQVMFPGGVRASSAQMSGANGISAHFLVGAAGIVLGVLALLDIHAMVLLPIAVIAFGAAMVLSSSSVWRLQELKRMMMGDEVSGATMLANEMGSESASMQALAGLVAIVLGILAVAGVNPAVLVMSALIVIGAALILTGSSLSATVVSFMRPATTTQR